MTDHEMTVLRWSDAGEEAGKALWLAVDQANIQREVRTFEVLLEVLGEEIDDDNERKMFTSAAMKAIPDVMISADQRKRIDADFENTYNEAVNELRVDEESRRADYYADQAREERLLGDAA